MDKTEMTATQVQPQYQAPFDIIPLPSNGILYPNNLATVKVEYLTASDENILTSPNLVQSGKVFKVLLEGKVKNLPFSVDELLIGDRNSILLFLRATGYGELYPVKITDPNTGESFETVVNLRELKQKELTAKPDENGEFPFILPASKKQIKFRLLRAKDEEELASLAERKMKANMAISSVLTDRMVRQITEIDGVRDKILIETNIMMMIAKDAFAFREYYDSIEPGIDTRITAVTPSGSLVETFFRIQPNFFWPDIRV